MSEVAVSSTEFQILLALAGGKRHGYGIMREVAEQTGGAVRVGPGTLYGAIKRMLASGLIAESAASFRDDDARRTSYYKLTPAGRKAASDAAGRLADLLSVAGRHGLLPKAAH